MTHGVSLKRIRLEHARTPDFPEGSASHGYELVAPLTADGHVDAEAWPTVKELCHVLRFWGDEPEQRGLLAHTRHGWCFLYGASRDAGEEPVFKLDRHRFEPGDYVTVTEPDGAQHPFRVAAVTPALPAE
ncbi:MAG: hypothetical protein ACLQUZ_08025 [Rhizomicrobium sp.]